MGKIKNTYDCSLILTHDLIGGKWKLRILWHIMQGDNRFSLLCKAIPDISTKVLGSQLKELEESGILHKEIKIDKPPKIIIYELAEQYKSLFQIMDDLCNFTKDYAVEHQIKVND